MKFDLDAKRFTEAAKWALNGVPPRPAVPVLAGMKITAREGSVTFSGFDYETCTTMTVAADVAEPGVTLVTGKRLHDMVSKLTGAVTAQAEGGKLTLTVGKAFRTLNELDDSEYPELPAIPDATGRVDAARLASAVKSVAPAASHDDTLPLLTGVFMKASGGTLDVVATDRYRLHVANIPWAGQGVEAIVPARELVILFKTVKAGTLDVCVATEEYGAERVTFTDGTRTLSTRTISGEYIRYESRMPAADAYPSSLTCDAAKLADLVTRVGKLAERNMPIEVHATKDGTVTVQVSDGDGAVSGETLDGPADLEGAVMDVAFNPGFLADALNAHGGQVTLGTNGIKPALCTSGDSGVRSLLVPLRMAKKEETPAEGTASTETGQGAA